MSLYKSKYKCQASLLKSVNPLPIFRNRNIDVEVSVDENIEDEYKINLGTNCGKRIYPYTNQDLYDRNIKGCEVESIILENEYLKATFLPSLGGRLISLFDKENNKELLFSSKNIQPCNLAIRNAWFSGGIEFNIGQYGHSLTTMDDIFASSNTDADGNKFLRIGEFEKMHEIYWHIDFHLPPLSKYLYLKCEITNFDDKIKSAYCWINTALIQEAETRVFASNNKALFLNPFLKQNKRGYTKIELPRINKFENFDASYPYNFPFSNEYFFTCDKDKIPYEVTINKNGYGIIDFSTSTLSSRKMFCWGKQNGGIRWQEYLNGNKNIQYFEAQAGITTTQLHGKFIEGKSTISFTQAFGAITIDDKLSQCNNYRLASDYVSYQVNSLLSKTDINKIDKILNRSCKVVEDEILHSGAIFAYIDSTIKNFELPSTYSFLTKFDNKSENIFEAMIKNTYTYSKNLFDNFVFPPQSFIKILSKYNDPYSLYLKAIMFIEEFKYDKALNLLFLSYKQEQHCIIARAIAQIYHIRKNSELRDKYYMKAINTCTKEIELITISSEYSQILCDNKEFDKEKVLLEKLDEYIKKFVNTKSISDISDSIALDKGFTASHFGNLEELEHCLFDREFSCIKEGDNPFIELFNEYMSLKISRQKGIKITNELRDYITKTYPIPHSLDFTMNAIKNSEYNKN